MIQALVQKCVITMMALIHALVYFTFKLPELKGYEINAEMPGLSYYSLSLISTVVLNSGD